MSSTPNSRRVAQGCTDPAFIIEGHEDLANYLDDVLEVIERPEAVFQGRAGSLIAVRSYGRRGHLAVFYREVSGAMAL